MKVAVLGLGRMGGAIAARLADSFDVVGYDPIVRPGPLLELIEDSDVLVTVLPGAAETRALPETFPALAHGALWIDLTSNDPRITSELGVAAAASGVRAAAAPMIGGPQDAQSGRLRFLLGAPDADREQCRRVLAPLGEVIDAGGRPEQSQTAKLLINGVWFTQLVVVAEALLVGEAHGIARDALRSLLADSPAGSRLLDDYGGDIVAGRTHPTFGLDRIVEELDAVTELADGAGVPAGALGLAAAVHRAALAQYGPIPGELLAAHYIAAQSAV